LKVKLLTILAVAVFVFSSVMMAQAQTETSIWRDEMNYQSADQLQAGGWTITHAAGVSFSGGAIILDGTQEDTAIHYSNNFPSGIYDWKVEDRSRWTLGSHCGNSVTAVTDKHSYTFMADGWYSTYVLYRDGQKTTFGSFQENKNEWLTLSIEKQGNQINMYYNGELKSTYTETDTSSSNLIGVAAVSPWRGGSEYDYFEVWSTGSNVLTPQTSLLSNPIVIGGIIGAVGVGVGGVLYFFVLGGSGGGSAGGAGSSNAGGLVNQNHPIASTGEISSSPLSGENAQTLISELYHQQISNVSDIAGIWQDFNQSVNEILSQNAPSSSSLMSLVESILGSSEIPSIVPSGIQSFLPPGTFGSPQSNTSISTPLTSIVDQLINHGQLLYSEGTTQGSINQDSYQHYLEQTANCLDTLSQMINTQQTATSNATQMNTH
jgi:hypothetical protein